MSDIYDFLRSRGFDGVEPTLDGQFHEFKTNSRKGWFIGSQFSKQSGEPIQIMNIGDWKTGEKYTYKSNGPYSESDELFATQKIKELKNKTDYEKKKRNKDTKQKAEVDLQNYSTNGESQYLIKKKIESQNILFCKNDIIIPCKDIEGEIWGYQRITETGEKYFLKGQKVQGTFHEIGNIDASDTLYICEGFATGASAYMATGTPVAVAFFAANLLEVGTALRKKYKSKRIIILADDDKYGSSGNAGRTKAEHTSQKISAKVILPKFKDESSKPTDFNDLHCLEGIEELKSQIQNQSTKEDDPYKPYENFFDSHIQNSKRERLTGRLFRFENEQWINVHNEIKELKSYGLSQKLLPDKIDIHLSRYASTKEKELLIKRQEWDGKDRINSLKDIIDFNGIEFEVFEETMKQWGANIFRRLENPGNQNICPIWKGGQNIGKDYLIGKLTEGFGRYYAKLTSTNDEIEIWRQVVSKLVMHIPEFDQTNKISVPFLKDLITRDYVEIRGLYQSDYESKPCHVSFISSANIDNLLRDTTGNRRFMIYEIKSIKKVQYEPNFSIQVLAQFEALYESDYRASDESLKVCADVLEKFKPENLEEMVLNVWDDRVSNLILKHGKSELTFDLVEPVILDLAKIFQWRPQTVSFLLRRTGRKRESNGKTIFSALRVDLKN
jgi:phage/plasmid primase-like uncharacterized protein